jgi:integrase
MPVLTDAKLRSLKPRPKLYRVADTGGLCIEVRPTGARLWRFRYRAGSKASMIGLGDYPAMSLQDARRERDKQRALLQAGSDPSVERKRQRQRDSADADGLFEPVAREWLGKQGKWSEATMDKAVAMLQTWAFPWIGQRPMRSITVADMLALIRRPEAQNKIETAQRLKQRCGQIFRYGIPLGHCDRDPTADLKGVLKTVGTRHHASVTERAKVGALLRAIDGHEGTLVVLCALRLSALTFVRPGELRTWEWREIEDEGTWRIPGAKMKMRVPHIVPLSLQAQAVLDDLRGVTGGGRYVFPSVRSGGRPMSENTVNAALRSLGYSNDDMTAHGFRSMASTLLNEEGWNRDWIERQLAHAEKDKVRGAYNYAEYLPDRRRMMQAWADLLDQLRNGGKVIPIRAAR